MGSDSNTHWVASCCYLDCPEPSKLRSAGQHLDSVRLWGQATKAPMRAKPRHPSNGQHSSARRYGVFGVVGPRSSPTTSPLLPVTGPERRAGAYTAGHRSKPAIFCTLRATKGRRIGIKLASHLRHMHEPSNFQAPRRHDRTHCQDPTCTSEFARAP